MTLSLKCHYTVYLVPYPIRLFDDLNLKFIKPFEVNTERDRSLNDSSNKTDIESPFQTKHRTSLMVLSRATRTISLSSERFRVFLFLTKFSFFGRKLKKYQNHFRRNFC